jgi:L-amino acid N-acyltransferase YncA
MSRIALRPAEPRDATVIAAIYRPAVLEGTASFEIDPPDAAEMGRRMAAIRDSGYPYLVAELDGLVVGYGYINAYRPRPAYRWSVEDSVYLSPAAQGRGVGRALLQRLIADAEAMGFRQMVAVIGDSAQMPSIRLHRACGFHFAGTLHAIGFKNGKWLDGVLMQRALGDGDRTPPV